MKVFATIFLAFLFTFNMYAQSNQNISGTVRSFEDNEPLPGVSIYVKGTTLGTVTDLDGNYTLAVPSSASTLIFSFIGFVTQEIEVTGRTRSEFVP